MQSGRWEFSLQLRPKSQCALFLLLLALNGMKRLMCRTVLKISSGIQRAKIKPEWPQWNGEYHFGIKKPKWKSVFYFFFFVCALWDAPKDLSFSQRQRKRENHTQTEHQHNVHMQRIRWMQFGAGNVTMWRRLQRSWLCVCVCVWGCSSVQATMLIMHWHAIEKRKKKK